MRNLLFVTRAPSLCRPLHWFKGENTEYEINPLCAPLFTTPFLFRPIPPYPRPSPDNDMSLMDESPSLDSYLACLYSYTRYVDGPSYKVSLLVDTIPGLDPSVIHYTYYLS